MPSLLLILVVSYLLGSIPFGYLLVRIFRGEDVRQSGSGNIGATNVSRQSPVLGALTLVLDAAKGFAAVQIAVALSHFGHLNLPLSATMAAAALLAIIGHMFPVWLGFRGGKGVATALGAFLRLNWIAVLAMLVVFLVVVVISRRISLGSIIAATFFPVADWLLSVHRDVWSTALTAAASLLIIFKHHQNIRRLLSGQEPRFSLGHK
jgi:acyl phosphate:glycerol-3-phosphate acyltransferase